MIGEISVKYSLNLKIKTPQLWGGRCSCIVSMQLKLTVSHLLLKEGEAHGKAARVVPSALLDGVADDGPQLFRRDLARVGKVNFMVQPGRG